MNTEELATANQRIAELEHDNAKLWKEASAQIDEARADQQATIKRMTNALMPFATAYRRAQECEPSPMSDVTIADCYEAFCAISSRPNPIPDPRDATIERLSKAIAPGMDEEIGRRVKEEADIKPDQPAEPDTSWREYSRELTPMPRTQLADDEQRKALALEQGRMLCSICYCDIRFCPHVLSRTYNGVVCEVFERPATPDPGAHKWGIYRPDGSRVEGICEDTEEASWLLAGAHYPKADGYYAARVDEWKEASE